MVENKRSQKACTPIVTTGVLQYNALLCKDSNNQPNPQLNASQKRRMVETFGRPCEKGMTMLMVSRITGIERANICRKIRELIDDGLVFPCGRYLCEVTLARAMYYTSNYRICLNHFIQITKGIWAPLEMETQMQVLTALRKFIVERVPSNELFGVEQSEARLTWNLYILPLIAAQFE